MNIVIVGDGKVGAALTEHLSTEGHDVVVIDKDPKVVEEMVNQYDVMGLCGNVLGRIKHSLLSGCQKNRRAPYRCPRTQS